MYSNAQYVSDTVIRVGDTYIPVDPANSDYANIMRLVEEGKLTIAPAGDN